MNGEPLKFTNIPGRGEGWGFVEDIVPDRAETFAGGGTLSQVGPQPGSMPAKPSADLVGAVQAQWEERDSFKEEVFKQIGGNPFTLTSDAEIRKFSAGGGYEDMFNEVFRGKISWRNRARMTPEQKIHWNREVLTEEAYIETETKNKRNQMKIEYDYMMGEFDARAKDVTAARKSVDAQTAKVEKARRVALEKRIKEQKTLSKEERKTSVASLRKLADNTKGYSQQDMQFYSKPDKKGNSFAVDKTPLEIQEMNFDSKKIGEPGFATIEMAGQKFYPRIPHISEETTADEIRRYGQEFQAQSPDLWPEYRKALSKVVSDAVADGSISRDKAEEWFSGKQVEQEAPAEPLAERLTEEQPSPEVTKAAAGIDSQIKDGLASLPEASKANINKMFASQLRRAKTPKDRLKIKRQMLKKINWVSRQPGTTEEAAGTVPYQAGVFADR
ncbi:MAG: hypothetical protein KAV87_28165 [Desulfobacteraceae bacterium]|nr:hypothetical protein [Desulfobacteraceae bacterium]